MFKKFLLLALATLWTSLIIVTSLINMNGVASSIVLPYKDKVVHFLFYFVFVTLWCLYFRSTRGFAKQSLSVLLTAIILGILIEFCQFKFTTSRQADVLDVLANTMGAILGYFFQKKTFKK